MNISRILFLLFVALCVWCTEIETSIQKFSLPGTWINMSLVGTKRVSAPNGIIQVQENQVPVVLMTEGKRAILFESGKSDSIKIGDGPSFRQYLTSKDRAGIERFKLVDWDYFCHKKFGNSGIKFDLTIKVKDETNSNPIDIDVGFGRYIEVDGKYLIIFAMGKYADRKNDDGANIYWQGYPDRNPDFRSIFTCPLN